MLLELSKSHKLKRDNIKNSSRIKSAANHNVLFATIQGGAAEK